VRSAYARFKALYQSLWNCLCNMAVVIGFQVLYSMAE
jgi:hypothetical protein